MNHIIPRQENVTNTNWIRSFATFAIYRGYAVSALQQNDFAQAIRMTKSQAISKATGQIGVLLANRSSIVCIHGRVDLGSNPFC